MTEQNKIKLEAMKMWTEEVITHYLNGKKKRNSEVLYQIVMKGPLLSIIKKIRSVKLLFGHVIRQSLFTTNVIIKVN